MKISILELKGFKNFDKNLQNLGLTKGRGLFLKFLGGSDDFIMQKVYLLRLMPVCVGLIVLAAYFWQSNKKKQVRRLL